MILKDYFYWQNEHFTYSIYIIAVVNMSLKVQPKEHIAGYAAI